MLLLSTFLKIQKSSFFLHLSKTIQYFSCEIFLITFSHPVPISATAKYNIKLKIDNLNIEDVFDAHRLKSLKNLFKDQFWPQASSDLHMTNIASSLEVGYRHSLYIGTVSLSTISIMDRQLFCQKSVK